jgi:hypothetical protein
MNSQAPSVMAWRLYRSAISARLVYLREIGRTAFWEFCNGILGVLQHYLPEADMENSFDQPCQQWRAALAGHRGRVRSPVSDIRLLTIRRGQTADQSGAQHGPPGHGRRQSRLKAIVHPRPWLERWRAVALFTARPRQHAPSV